MLGVGFYLADSEEEAIRRFRIQHDERFKWFAPFGFVRYSDDQGRPWGTPGSPARIPDLEDGMAQKAWICGPPEKFVKFLQETEEKSPGLEHFMLQWPEGQPWAEFQEQIRMFAREVMPHFTPQRASDGSSPSPAVSQVRA